MWILLLLNKSLPSMKHIFLTALFLLSCFPAYSQTAKEAQELHDKGRQCFNAGKIEEGKTYTLQAMEMRKKLFGEVNEDYITSLNNYATSFAIEKNNSKALELQKKVLQLSA